MLRRIIPQLSVAGSQPTDLAQHRYTIVAFLPLSYTVANDSVKRV